MSQLYYCLYFIREILDRKSESQIYGSVLNTENDLQTNNPRNSYLQGIKIEIKSNKNTFYALTDKNGIYRFNNIPEGSYQITALASPKYKVYYPQNESFTILKNKKICLDEYGCSLEFSRDAAYYKFYVDWNNIVEGKVIDGEGKPVEKFRIRLLPVAATNAELIQDKFSSGDFRHSNGEYYLPGQTPGRYILAIEIDSPTEKGGKLRLFYPQATSSENAQIFNVGETTKLNLDFALPKDKITRKFVGDILRENGGSVGGIIQASLDSSENPNDEENKQFAWTRIDAKGQIAFDVFENSEYWLHIWADDFDKESGKVKGKLLIKTEKIKIGKEEAPRKIVIPLPLN